MVLARYTEDMLRAFSVLAFLLMVAVLAGLMLTGQLFHPSPAVIAIQLAGLALMVWARITFGRRSFHAAADPTGGGLVTTGPYRYIRHPIYTAACLIVWPAPLAYRSPLAIALAALLTVGAVIRMLFEERMVTERYPEYRDYAARTRRMVPFLF